MALQEKNSASVCPLILNIILSKDGFGKPCDIDLGIKFDIGSQVEKNGWVGGRVDREGVDRFVGWWRIKWI